jgi:hypothetical protein
VDQIPVAITAAPRPNEPGIQAQSINSFVRAGFKDITIYAEPGTDLPTWVKRDLYVIRRPVKLGEWHNWMSAVEETLIIRSSPRIISAQDDILLCKGVSPFLSSLQWPSRRCGALHFYTSKKYVGYQDKKISQLSRIHSCKMCGACGIVFLRRAAEDLVLYGRTHGWRGHTAHTITEPSLMEGLDTYIGETLTRLGWEIWVCNPSLGQHISKESTMPNHGGPYGSRIAANFPGEDANAQELFYGCS